MLIIDDSVDLNSAIKKNLVSNNYVVDSAYDGQKGLRMALSNEYDIILLDIMLPQMNGYKVLENIRKEGRTTPVIMITAKNDITDKVDGLELGADDYIQKPFNMNELIARIRALMRRSSICNYDSDKICYADIVLVSSAKKVIKDELQITLTPQEFSIIKYLIKNSSVVVPQNKISAACSKEEWDSDTVENYISGLRKKINYICSNVQILSIKGVGYKLCF